MKKLVSIMILLALIAQQPLSAMFREKSKPEIKRGMSEKAIQSVVEEAEESRVKLQKEVISIIVNALNPFNIALDDRSDNFAQLAKRMEAQLEFQAISSNLDILKNAINFGKNAAIVSTLILQLNEDIFSALKKLISKKDIYGANSPAEDLTRVITILEDKIFPDLSKILKPLSTNFNQILAGPLGEKPLPIILTRPISKSLPPLPEAKKESKWSKFGGKITDVAGSVASKLVERSADKVIDSLLSKVFGIKSEAQLEAEKKMSEEEQKKLLEENYNNGKAALNEIMKGKEGAMNFLAETLASFIEELNATKKIMASASSSDVMDEIKNSVQAMTSLTGSDDAKKLAEGLKILPKVSELTLELIKAKRKEIEGAQKFFSEFLDASSNKYLTRFNESAENLLKSLKKIEKVLKDSSEMIEKAQTTYKKAAEAKPKPTQPYRPPFSLGGGGGSRNTNASGGSTQQSYLQPQKQTIELDGIFSQNGSVLRGEPQAHEIYTDHNGKELERGRTYYIKNLGKTFTYNP